MRADRFHQKCSRFLNTEAFTHNLRWFGKEEDPDSIPNPFEFRELTVFNVRLVISGVILLITITLVHFWLQLFILFLLYNLLQSSEGTLREFSQHLMDHREVPLQLRSQMLMYGVFDTICAYFCLKILFTSVMSYTSLPEVIVSACLASEFVFLVISAMKQIGSALRFFHAKDIENGSLNLLTIESVIIRYIFVVPFWYSYLAETPLNRFPTDPTWIPLLYLVVKVIGFGLLCNEFHIACGDFVASIMLRVPDGTKCENCGQICERVYSLQCRHLLCETCMERCRSAHACCSICGFRVPRKWVFRYSLGCLSSIDMLYIL